tara:strand:+ start:59 stop:322 length:264 start_codon:yes stop_codon:yes gene_type:complete
MPSQKKATDDPFADDEMWEEELVDFRAFEPLPEIHNTAKRNEETTEDVLDLWEIIQSYLEERETCILDRATLKDFTKFVGKFSSQTL